MAKPTLELAMIVNNGAAGLRECLESVRPIVDRIAVGDTGSSDESAAIARSYGAIVIDVAWEEDFAAARNHVLRAAECDWVLVLDADEMLDDAAPTLIPPLLLSEDVWGYDVWVRNYIDTLDFRGGGEHAIVNASPPARARGYPAYVRSLHTRLFKRDPEIFFEHRVHETVADRLAAVGRGRACAPFAIHHFGYVEDSPDRRSGKSKTYYELSRRRSVEEPRNARAQLEMGMCELDFARNPERALPYFLRARLLNARSAVAWMYAGICFTRLGKHDQALASLGRSIELHPEHAIAHSSLGDLHFAAGRYGPARASFTRARALGDASPVCLAKLGAAEVRLGMAEGIGKLQQAVADAPHTAELYDMLATGALLAGRKDAAREAVERRLALGSADSFGVLVAGSVYLALDCRLEAAALLADALARFPGDQEILAFASHPALQGDAGAPLLQV